MWGSGNVLTERELIPAGENTLYNTWNGEGILGPRVGVAVETLPALWARLTWAEFLDRHGDLPPGRCGVFTGQEVLGIGCDAACAQVAEVCDEDLDACLSGCASLPRSLATCLEHLDACTPLESCGLTLPL